MWISCVIEAPALPNQIRTSDSIRDIKLADTIRITGSLEAPAVWKLPLKEVRKKISFSTRGVRLGPAFRKDISWPTELTVVGKRKMAHDFQKKTELHCEFHFQPSETVETKSMRPGKTHLICSLLKTFLRFFSLPCANLHVIVGIMES